ncbi:MAG: MFS transporter [Xanthobacteraceae bacterium]|nr:MAG: MFS transporter [Xanthobacteraceae bacterium]
MDISSEMIHALLPLYLVTVLGASTLEVGFIEGIAEATAMIVKIFSGALSDRLGRRKLLAALGYGIAALTKPIFPLATGLGWIVAARFVDRIGKGIRGAPRDALIADITPEAMRGAAFGLRQALDTVGAFIGPLMAIGLMALSSDSFRLVFWIAVIPALLSAALILFAVEEPARPAATGKATGQAARWRLADLAHFSPRFWLVVAVAAVLTLARFSDAFLILRAQNIGLPVTVVPLILVVMNVVYALTAYPAGALSDRLGRRGLLIAGTVMLIAANAVLAYGDGVPGLMAGVVLWGLHMGLTQSLFAALVADSVAERLRGTAFGLFNVASGVALFAASVIAGALWDRFGPAATFMAGAVFAALALPGLIAFTPRENGQTAS